MSIEQLVKDMALMKKSIDSSSPTLQMTYSQAALSGTIMNKPSTSGSPLPLAAASTDERKFNVVVTGIAECPSGLTRFERQSHDMKSVADVLNPLDQSIQSNSVKDLYRLGKYNAQHEHPRPILVKFIRSADAATVLSRKSALSHPYYIHPDRPKSERLRNSALMKERCRLIQRGITRKSIKIRKENILVDNKLHGTLETDGQFIVHESSPCCELEENPILLSNTHGHDDSIVAYSIHSKEMPTPSLSVAQTTSFFPGQNSCTQGSQTSVVTCSEVPPTDQTYCTPIASDSMNLS